MGHRMLKKWELENTRNFAFPRIQLAVMGTILMLGLLLSCQSDLRENRLYSLPAYNETGHLQMVVEIPSGTNAKIEYDAKQKSFAVDQIDGRDRHIDFLSYPGNYGFIPSTLGGDGDPLDVLVLSKQQPTGTVLAIQPIGALLLTDEGEEDTKIIACPIDSQLHIIKATDFATFRLRYQAAQQILENWFSHYDPHPDTYVKGWRDERFALDLVEKAMENSN